MNARGHGKGRRGTNIGKAYGLSAPPLCTASATSANAAAIFSGPRKPNGRSFDIVSHHEGTHIMSTTVFKSLADTTFDSVEGYRKAIDKATDPQLKQALTQRLAERELTLQKLNSELQRQGDELVTKGTTAGSLHRVWTDITDAFENGNEAAAERVEEGEDYLKGKFDSALKTDALDPQERAVVQQVYAEICEGERFGNMIEKQYD